MSRGLNRVEIIGNLGGDPEIRFTPSGDQVVNFTVAVSESWTGKDGQKNERVEWFRLVAWRKLAEICGQYLKKGNKVYISGKMQTRSWEDQQGVKKYTTEIVANEMIMLGGEAQSEQRQDQGQNQQQEPEYPTGGDQDLPF